MRVRRVAPATGLPLAPMSCVAGASGAVSASANSRAFENRSAGALANARITALSSDRGTTSRSTRNDVGRSVISFAINARAVGPVTGGSPASISYVTAPRA